MKKKIAASQVQSELSIQRTKLANHRTFLAYFRTAVALIVAGAGLMKFIQNDIWFSIGVACIVLTPIVLVFGIFDYFSTKKLIQQEAEYFKKCCNGDPELSENDNDM